MLIRSEDAGSVVALVEGACAALDAAEDLIVGKDLSGLPNNVQQAIRLIRAAHMGAIELRENLGIITPEGNNRPF